MFVGGAVGDGEVGEIQLRESQSLGRAPAPRLHIWWHQRAAEYGELITEVAALCVGQVARVVPPLGLKVVVRAVVYRENKIPWRKCARKFLCVGIAAQPFQRRACIRTLASPDLKAHPTITTAVAIVIATSKLLFTFCLYDSFLTRWRFFSHPVTKLSNTIVHVREGMLNRILGARACPATHDIVHHHAYVSTNIAAELKLTMNRLKAQAITDDGLHVDYARIRSSEDYAAYREHMVPRLRMFDPNTLLSREDKLAFWINLYNAVVIDSVIAFGVQPASPKARLACSRSSGARPIRSVASASVATTLNTASCAPIVEACSFLARSLQPTICAGLG